jgi:hypothetical protein
MVAIADPANNEDVQQEFDGLQPSVTKSAADAQTLLLSFIRVATIRAKLVTVDLESIDIALKQGLISLDGALAWLDDLGLFEIVVQRPRIAEGGRQ